MYLKLQKLLKNSICSTQLYLVLININGANFKFLKCHKHRVKISTLSMGAKGTVKKSFLVLFPGMRRRESIRPSISTLPSAHNNRSRTTTCLSRHSFSILRPHTIQTIIVNPQCSIRDQGIILDTRGIRVAARRGIRGSITVSRDHLHLPTIEAIEASIEMNDDVSRRHQKLNEAGKKQKRNNSQGHRALLHLPRLKRREAAKSQIVLMILIAQAVRLARLTRRRIRRPNRMRRKKIVKRN